MTRRNYITADRLSLIRDDLSESDHLIVDDIVRFRLMSAQQLQLLHFGNEPADGRRCRRQLARLADSGVIDRLPRRVGGRGKGSDSTLYRLGRAGRRLRQISGAAGPSWQPSAAFAAHTLAIADLYVELRQLDVQQCLRLVEFTAEPGAWRTFTWKMKPVTLKPDAFVRLDLEGVSWQYFVEIDRGTESSKVIARKCETYLDYLDASPTNDTFPAVLFLVDSHRSYHAANSDDRVEQIRHVIADQRPPANEMFVARRRDRPPWLEPT